MDELQIPPPDLYNLSLEGDTNVWASEPQATVDARWGRYVQPIEGRTISRSAFRFGTVTVLRTGLEFHGRGTVPSVLFAFAGGVVGIIGWGMALLWSFHEGNTREVFGSFFPLAFAGLFLGAMIDAIVTEVRQQPLKIAVPWQEIEQCQVAPKNHYAVLLYRDPAEQRIRFAATGPDLLALPLKAKDPAVIASFAAIIDQLAPNTVVRDVQSNQWPPTHWPLSTRIVAGIAVFLGLAGVARWIYFLVSYR